MVWIHKPVLLNEMTSIFQKHCREATVILDGTIGSGGYALSLLETLGAQTMVVGLDKDEEALKRTEKRLETYVRKKRLLLFQEDFKDFDRVLEDIGIERINGVVLDLGLSSEQLEDGLRGFSFTKDGPLDMRMDRRYRKTAADLVNKMEEKELAGIFLKYGEERYARKIAALIVKERKKHPLSTTSDLVKLIHQAIPTKERTYRIHPATRVFQALRIAVNDELKSLETFLAKILSYLAPSSVLSIISFHSLEDRIVKHTFSKWANPCICPPSMPVCQCGRLPEVTPVTKGALKPSLEETAANPRARSGRLRAVKKC